MSFTAVVAKLRHQRRISKQATVACVREEYGDAFDTFFSYRKGNSVHVMSDPSAITRRYQQLKDGNKACISRQ